MPENGPHAEHDRAAPPHQSFWLWVLCLTGVDYFSTLGYQPSIAFEATGRLAPLATLVLVLVTLFAAVPVYFRVAARSSTGQGSISMLERLLRGWGGKLLVLVLLGFAATDFIITITLSSADAAEHLIHNPLWKETPAWLHSQLTVTNGMLIVLGAVYLRGFREVIGVAVAIVGVYLLLNAMIILCGLVYLLAHSQLIADWYTNIRAGRWLIPEVESASPHWGSIILVCLIFFPKLALGLSGFETGVAVMPLIKGDATDTFEKPAGRIRNTHKLLLTAALIMSVLLLGSSIVTSMLIPAKELLPGGHAVNRALAFMAHGDGPYRVAPWLFGNVFGTLYDASTVSILWFAGASALSGLLSLVPRYLPRYGMAPEWATATRPFILLLIAVSLLVTWIFNADVVAQGGAYATGVMVLMSSACIAVVINRWNEATGPVLWRVPWRYVLIAAVFLYTTAAIVYEKPEGVTIASFFIAAVIVVSASSRIMRSTELRFVRFDFANAESRFMWDTLKHLDIPVLVPHRPGGRILAEKEKEIRDWHHLDAETPLVFIEAEVGDASEFYQSPLMEIVHTEERFVVRVTRCASVAHVIAVIALTMAQTGRPPELHFGWSDESPMRTNLRFLLFGEGNVPWIVRQLLLAAEPDRARRPRVFIG
jgi:hypothetical protein